MNKEQRQNYIINKLKKEKSFFNKDLSELLGISFETIRRDVEELELQGRLKRIHGGAIFVEPKSEIEKNFLEREHLNAKEKTEIAQKAILFVKEGMSIALDVSTTNTAIARLLVKQFNKITIITNSLPIIDLALKNTSVKVIIPGGILYQQERCIIGDKGIEHIQDYNIDLFFMSISGIDLRNGLTDYGHEEMKIKKAFLQNAKETMIVADHTKFNNISLIKLSHFNKNDKIITDDEIPKETYKQYSNYIQII